ncbi:MAG: AzlD domain-containing protein [Alphaproteobacteria bacterium]|nr:AzlD domain-containing protein [Alphaproteobacteria bacterium]
MGEGSLAILMASAVNYAWRALGVAIGGAADPRHPVILWAGLVTYAMLAGLFVRMIVMPAGALAAVGLDVRIGATAVALAVFLAVRRNALLGTLAGMIALIAATVLAR